MSTTDKERFAVAMFGIAEEFGGSLTKNNLQLKWESLKRFPIDHITKAISYLSENRTKTFPLVPTTQEIIEATEIIQQPQLAIGSAKMAEIQANEVLAFLHENGAGAAPVFRDPLTKCLMSTVWPYASWGKSLTEKDKTWWRKEFINTFKVYSETARTFERLNIPDQFTQIANSVTKKIPYSAPLQIAHTRGTAK